MTTHWHSFDCPEHFYGDAYTDVRIDVSCEWCNQRLEPIDNPPVLGVSVSEEVKADEKVK